MRSVVFSALKNEGPFILEWVAHHKALGFDDVVIVSNDCDDGSFELLDALDREGIIRHIPNVLEGPEPPQVQAEKKARDHNAFAFGDYVLWLDMDEFLCPPENATSVQDMITEIELRKGHAVLLNWRVMGDSNRRGLPNGFIIDQFTGCARDFTSVNREVKALFQYSEAIDRLHFHQPMWKPDYFKEIKLLDGRGAELPETYVTRRSKFGTPRSGVTPRRAMSRLGRINHYAVRTPDLFQMKQRRGLGFFGKDNGEFLDRYSEEYYTYYNQNIRQSHAILRFRDPLLDVYQSYVSLPRIAQAHSTCVVNALKRIPPKGQIAA